MTDPSLIVARQYEGSPAGYLPITEFVPLQERIAELEQMVLRLEHLVARLRAALDQVLVIAAEAP